MKRLILTYLLFIQSFIVFCQHGNNWTIGKMTGISFGVSPPFVFQTDSSKFQGKQCVSNCKGELMFYAYQDHIWNRYHTRIPNDSLLSSYLSFFIPCPGDDSSYFYIQFNNKLYFTVLDLRLDSGRGAIKNKPLKIIDSSASYAGFVKHANDTDYWLLVKFNKFYLKAFKITAQGVDTTNIIQSIYLGNLSNGAYTPERYIRSSNNGDILISPNTSGIAIAQHQHFLYDFNRKTGVTSNERMLIPKGAYSNSFENFTFSPNDSIIYAFTNNYKTDTGAIFQLNTYNPPSSSLRPTITFYNKSSLHIYAAQLAPDNKIYIAKNSDSAISCILFPDKWGDACCFKLDYFSCKPFDANTNLFPCLQFPVKRITPQFTFGNGGCGYDTLHFTFDADSAFKSYHWYFGDGDSAVGKSVVHQYKNAGSYYVKLGCELGNCGYMQWVGDSVTIQFKPNVSIEDSTYYTCGSYHVQTKISYRYCDTLNLHLGNRDTVLYTTNTDTVHTVIYTTVLDTNGTYIYYAAAKNANCHDSVATKHIVLFEPSITASFTPDYITSCGYSTITLTDSSAGNDSIIAQRKWTIEFPIAIGTNTKQYDTASSNKLKLIVQDTGYYNAKLIYVTKQGCMDSLYKTKVFRILPQPDVYIDSNMKNPLCFGDSFILTAKQKNTGYPPLTSYKWNMGQVTTPSIKVDSSNIYYVAAYNNYGCGSTSNKVKIDFLPQLFASVKKAKDSLYVITNRPVVAWEWYKDTILYNTSSSLFHPPTGRYSVTVTDANGCQASSASLLHTGIPALEPADMLSVVEAYPNPSNGCVTLNAASRSFTYKIYNTAGQLVLFGNGSNGSQTIDLVGSPAGLYYIQILSTDMNVTKRLLLQKD